MRIYKYAVIGGGVIGCSIAYFLARDGQDVLLLEKGSLADGSSSRCDGNLQVGDCASGIDTEFVMKSLALFPEVAADLADDIGYRPMDSMFVFETEEEIPVGRALVERKNADGCRMRLLSREEALALEPNLAEDLTGGILTYGDGIVNPMMLTIGLAKGAEKYGAAIRTGRAVTGISRTEDGLFILESPEETFYAENVVNAAGVWAPEIGKMAGLDIPIRPRQGQILVIEEADGFVGRTITEFGYIMTKQESSDFVRNVPEDMEKYGIAALVEPTEGGTLLVGSSRTFTGEDIRSDDRIISLMAQRICRFLPGMKKMNLIRTYCGLRPYTADHRAILSATPVPGFYIAAGHEGSGITLSLETGKVMMEYLTGKTLSLDLTPFRFDRFAGSGTGADDADDAAPDRDWKSAKAGSGGEA
ncbi:MAG: FAD-binding oxidoreductase [Lachnospiraceae bacterium]|nr:FAD-binding oxidoreductase [Lachnospiraceae bacterium]